MFCSPVFLITRTAAFPARPPACREPPPPVPRRPAIPAASGRISGPPGRGPRVFQTRRYSVRIGHSPGSVTFPSCRPDPVYHSDRSCGTRHRHKFFGRGGGVQPCGCTATGVRSKSSFPAPILTAGIPASWIISAAPGPTMWHPDTIPVDLATTRSRSAARQLHQHEPSSSRPWATTRKTWDETCRFVDVEFGRSRPFGHRLAAVLRQSDPASCSGFRLREYGRGNGLVIGIPTLRRHTRLKHGLVIGSSDKRGLPPEWRQASG